MRTIRSTGKGGVSKTTVVNRYGAAHGAGGKQDGADVHRAWPLRRGRAFDVGLSSERTEASTDLWAILPRMLVSRRLADAHVTGHRIEMRFARAGL